MKKFSKGDTMPRFDATCDVVAKTITTGFYVRLSDTDETVYGIEGVCFDFHGCTDAEILEMAGRTARIWYQGTWRSKSTSSADRIKPSLWERKVDIKGEMLAEQERGPVNPFAAAIRNISKLTDVQKAELKALLG